MSSGGFYDISIWEEIRSIVSWKTDRLVESINQEIPKDASLAEFHGKHPVPFQLQQIMEQRATVWVQRLYDICCDAYKSRGKSLSADFDRAIWTYRIYPFIMGETDSQIHSGTMGGFLNLLLCAIGSPPERRQSLTLDEKECCFGVRSRVYETWHDKLHHLPPRINEAAAVMAQANARERRAALIFAGLPPDNPPPAMSAHPLAQSEESLPPKASNSDPKTPPSNSALRVPDSLELEGDLAKVERFFEVFKGIKKLVAPPVLADIRERFLRDAAILRIENREGVCDRLNHNSDQNGTFNHPYKVASEGFTEWMESLGKFAAGHVKTLARMVSAHPEWGITDPAEWARIQVAEFVADELYPKRCRKCGKPRSEHSGTDHEFSKTMSRIELWWRIVSGEEEDFDLYEYGVASDLLHEAADLPAASVLLDIGYAPAPGSNEVERNIDPVSTRTNPQALPWLQTFNYSPNVDLAYTNPYGSTGSSQVNELTEDFIAALASLDQQLKPCKTFSDIAQNVASANSRRNATWPVYFSQTSAPSSFCFSGGHVPSSHMSVTLTQVKVDPTLNFADVSATIPAESQASWADLLIDGVLIEHRAVVLDPNKPDSGGFSKRVPLSVGTHLVELKAGRGSSNAFIVGSAVANVPGNPVAASETSDRLRAVILGPLSSESVTSSASLRVAFVVAELDGYPLEYEIRNNGALVLQDIVRNAPTLQHLEIVQQVPVGIGNNTITIEAKHGQLFASKTTTVVRRPAQAVRAVLIGVDNPTGAPALTGAVADARLMAKIVARYTDAVPGEVNLLTGSSATRQAIVNAIANSTVTHAADPDSGVDKSDEMLLLYFAGYGATFQDVNGQIVRCILPSDFDATHPVTSCIATTEIDRFLDSWGRSVVIFDTSYDGLAGEQEGNERSRPTFSRTYKDLLTPDSGWRLSAGTDRPDRVFLVASGTNSAALESRERSQGLFTWSLTRAIEEQVSVSGTGVQEVSLFDAFNRARNDTSAQSDRHQVPLMKGTLSSPFVFVDKAAGDLKREASAIDHRLRDDITSMRAPNPSELRRLSSLYDKILSIDPSDVEAPRGKVRTMLYGGEKGDLASAAEQVDNTLNSFTLQSDPINHSEWLMLRSELKMRRGDLAGAITDCEEAVRLNGASLRAAAFLGELYAASLEYEKAIPLLQGALERYASANDVSVTQEEWGQFVLLSYLCLKRTGHDGTAAVLLRSYSQSFAGNNAFHKLVPILKQLMPQTSHAVLMGDLGVEAPWSHLVSSFMVDPKKYEAQLQSFRADTAKYDLKDEKEFYCMLHFYLGISRLFGRAPQQADIEFQSAVKTDQTQYVEYWISRAESNRLRAQSTVGSTVPAISQVVSR